VWCSLWGTDWILKYYLDELLISTLSNELWNKILPSLSQASTTHHPNVFTHILSLSEGRAGIAWVPYNKMLFFPLRYKAPLAFPQMFSLYFYSYYHFWLSLTFTLFLLEGRAIVAWEPSNKMMLFLPPRKIKCLSLHLLISSLNLLFIYPSHLSLSLFGFKGLTAGELQIINRGLKYLYSFSKSVFYWLLFG
jgi:hypothetical protein